jgi:hypothetical protein
MNKIKKTRSSLARAAKARKKMRFSTSHLPAYEANSAGKNFFVKSDIFIKFDQDFYLVLFFSLPSYGASNFSQFFRGCLQSTK